MSKKPSLIIMALLSMFSAQVLGKPLVSIEASGQTRVTVPKNTLAAIYYTITNNSSQPLTLNLEPLQGITQNIAGASIICKQPIQLPPHGSCLLTLVANGNNLPTVPVTGLQLYRKTKEGKVYSKPPKGQEIYAARGSNRYKLIVISGDPLTLFDVPKTIPPKTPITKVLTVQNASTNLIIKSIAVSLASMSEANPAKVIIDASDCMRVNGLFPGQTCAINFTPARLSSPIKMEEKFKVIISANGSSMYQTTAHLTLSPFIPITYDQHPQIVPFPSSSGLQLTLNNISDESQHLNFTTPEYWRDVSYTGCPDLMLPGSSCTLTFTSKKANNAGIFTIKALSAQGQYKSRINIPIAFADADNNLVYAVSSSTYYAVNIDKTFTRSPLSMGFQWCPPGIACNQITTNATDLYNGMSNSLKIRTAFAGADLNTYAAGYCATIPSGNLNLHYYLPAVCELGNSLQGADCHSNRSNIYNNLIQYGFLSNLNGPLWSSTEINAGAAWLEFYYGPIIAWQYEYLTDFYATVVCVTKGSL